MICEKCHFCGQKLQVQKSHQVVLFPRFIQERNIFVTERKTLILILFLVKLCHTGGVSLRIGEIFFKEICQNVWSWLYHGTKMSVLYCDGKKHDILTPYFCGKYICSFSKIKTSLTTLTIMYVPALLYTSIYDTCLEVFTQGFALISRMTIFKGWWQKDPFSIVDS